MQELRIERLEVLILVPKLLYYLIFMVVLELDCFNYILKLFFWIQNILLHVIQVLLII